MPIRFPEPPPSIDEALSGRRMRGLPGALGRRFDLGEADEEPPALPVQPVFTAGLDEVIDGTEAEKAVSTPPSWRYSGFDAEGRPEVLELPEQAESGAVASGDDRFGPMIREALAVADQDPRVHEHDFDARLFRIPALSLLALWLHTAEALDLFVPVGRPAAGLEANTVYDDEEFMSKVRAAAEQMGGHYSGADAPDELGS
jgi:hypothetical protein